MLSAIYNRNFKHKKFILPCRVGMLQHWLVRGDSEVLKDPVSFYRVSLLFSLSWLLSQMVIRCLL